MSILSKHPKSVLRAIQGVPDTDQFIVVNEGTGIPQYFAQFTYHNYECLGKFVDAKDHLNPAYLYDYETAIYLIGQTAIYQTMGDEKLQRYNIIPVLSRAISSHSTLSK